MGRELPESSLPALTPADPTWRRADAGARTAVAGDGMEARV